MKYVGIIDYNMGNLHSVYKAVEKVGGYPLIINTPKDLDKVSALVLPGVGSFDLAMQQLQDLDFVQPIKAWINNGSPFLGICLGLQLLFQASEEGTRVGLQIFEGHVIKINSNLVANIPNMGWNQLNSNVSYLNNKWVFFVHSYHVVVYSSLIESSYIKYGKLLILSSINYKNISGVQFHPEKSGYTGLLILKQFLSNHNCL
nr:imidazole glycerol phosphate synthase subunit hisH [Cavernulicola chilensis]